jgi:hypothetical protein
MLKQPTNAVIIERIDNFKEYTKEQFDNINSHFKILNGNVASNSSKIIKLESERKYQKWFLGIFIAICAVIISFFSIFY